MRIEKFFNKHGSIGCYMCKKKNARWSVTMPLLKKHDTGADIIVFLCSDCVELNEDQLRIFFLG